jgi:DNA invertase Pin-like site-specific DNA recombinase
MRRCIDAFAGNRSPRDQNIAEHTTDALVRGCENGQMRAKSPWRPIGSHSVFFQTLAHPTSLILLYDSQNQSIKPACKGSFASTLRFCTNTVSTMREEMMTSDVPSPSLSVRNSIGYVRITSEDETTHSQVQELRAAGCQIIHEEQASSVSDSRPLLSKLLREFRRGDVLVVVRIDRLARSVSDLLAVAQQLEARQAYFRSLHDLIDTSSPESVTVVKVLAAVDRFQRSLGAERTRAGMQAAKARGRLAGNPGLREQRPDAIRAVSEARQRTYTAELMASSSTWLPTVMRLRPQHSWQDVVRVLNGQGQNWSVEKLRRAVHRLVHERVAEGHLVQRSPRRPPEDRQMTLVAGIACAHPDLSLRGIANKLDQMRERTPRGRRQWQASSVKSLLDQARRLGLSVPYPSDDS